MINKVSVFFLLISIIFLLSCETNNDSHVISLLSDVELDDNNVDMDLQFLRKTLGIKMDSVLLLFRELKVEGIEKETMEFEGVEWNSLGIYDLDNDLCVKFEFSVEENVVNRVTIFSSKIEYKFGNVGASFLKIIDFVDSTKLNYFQDGLLGLVSLQDPNIVYFLDTTKIGNKVFYGINNLGDIPLKTRIDKIVMFDSNL